MDDDIDGDKYFSNDGVSCKALRMPPLKAAHIVRSYNISDGVPNIIYEGSRRDTKPDVG